jgi:hypothetical protein
MDHLSYDESSIVNRNARPGFMGVTKPRRRKKASTGATILARLIEPEEASFSPEAARSILRLKFTRSDQVQVNKLSLGAQEGTLTVEEHAELEEYIRVADLLAMLKSKARLSLKESGLNDDV